MNILIQFLQILCLLSMCATMASGSGEVTVPHDCPLRIVALGDSTTYGYGVEDAYPKQLAWRLSQIGIDVSVINSGINGDTTGGAQLRFDRDVLQHDPDVVIIQFGLNDQSTRFYTKPEGQESYVSQKEYEANLRHFITALRSRGITTILMTPNPMCWTPTLEQHYPDGPYLDPPNGGNLLLGKYVALVRKVAREERVPLVDIYRLYLDFERNSGESLHALFLGDGVHPNERGYTMNVEHIARVLTVYTAGVLLRQKSAMSNSEIVSCSNYCVSTSVRKTDNCVAHNYTRRARTCRQFSLCTSAVSKFLR